MSIQHSTLANGMRVYTEFMPYVETLSLGIWLPYGSRHEDAETNGMFHFIEHTLFKGTARRNARAIAEQVDAAGGVLDAYTAKEETCYSFKVRAARLPQMLEILADMLLNPLFDEAELEREQQVILEEIKMEEDTPEDKVYEDGLQAFWEGHPISRPILGLSETVESFDRERTRSFHQRFYRPACMVVCAAGKVDHDQLCRLLEASFPPGDAQQPPVAIPAAAVRPPRAHAYQIFSNRPHLEQVSFCINFDAVPYGHEQQNTLYVLNNLLGGNMSSRLFQRIREEHGLAYSVGSFSSLYSDCGIFSVYGACSPRNLNKVLDLALDVLREAVHEEACEDEVARAREQLISATLMGLETTGSRSGALARDILLLDEIYDLNAFVAQVEAITPAQVHQLARDLLRDDTLGLSAVGRLKKMDKHYSLNL